MSRVPTRARRTVAAGLVLGCAIAAAPRPAEAVAPSATAAPDKPASCPGTTIPHSPTSSPNAPTASGSASAKAKATSKTPAPTMIAPPVIPKRDVVVGGDALAGNGLIAPEGVPAPPPLDATSYVIADATSGDIIAAKAPHAQLRPASTLKALSALVMLPKLSPKKVVVAKDEDMNADGTKVGMVTGNKYPVQTLFQAMLMSSANDAVYALARTYPGGRATMVSRANAYAKHLGALDTVVKDPSGLDAPGQLSSAYDLALVGRAALKNKTFRAYSTTREATFPGATREGGMKVAPYGIQNHNKLLYNYKGAIGVKNGYTTLAHGTFIAAATRGGRTYLLTYMCSDRITWHEMAKALDWAFANGAKARPVGELVAAGSTEATPSATPSTTAVNPASASGSASTSPSADRFGLKTPANNTERWVGTGILAALVLAIGFAGARRIGGRGKHGIDG